MWDGFGAEFGSMSLKFRFLTVKHSFRPSAVSKPLCLSGFCLSVGLSVFDCLVLSLFCNSLSFPVWLCHCLCLRLYVCTCLSVSVFICLYLTVCICLYTSVCFCLSLSVCLCMFVCLGSS